MTTVICVIPEAGIFQRSVGANAWLHATCNAQLAVVRQEKVRRVSYSDHPDRACSRRFGEQAVLIAGSWFPLPTCVAGIGRLAGGTPTPRLLGRRSRSAVDRGLVNAVAVEVAGNGQVAGL